MAIELQSTPNPNTSIVDILTMEDVQAREDALKKRLEDERQKLIRDPHAFSAGDIPHLTDARLVALVAEEKITEGQYVGEMLARHQIIHPNKNEDKIRKELINNLPIAKLAYAHDQAVNAALNRRQMGIRLTDDDQKLLAQENKQLLALDAELDELGVRAQPFSKTASLPHVESTGDNVNQSTPINIQSAESDELLELVKNGGITFDIYQAELQRRWKLTQSQTPSPSDPSQSANYETATGVAIEHRNLSPSDAEKWITGHVPKDQQRGLLTELINFRQLGNNYSVTIGRDGRGYRLVRFQTPNPWDYVKKDAAQSVTREVRRETGKQINRLINPDYAHNEMLREYKLVREALPEGTATRQILEKTDKAVSAVLTASGLTAEAANLLVNAIRGALLESPELKFKVAALIPDDLVRQSYVVGARTMGNTLREYIHRKYHLPDRPKQTPILVNTLGQLKPEQYRTQDAQKVGVDMRDLSREKAREFIITNVPTEKQASALETIDRLPGNTFGVQIMDTGWVRISASAREPRSYDNRPRYGSYDATPKPVTS